MQQQQQQRRLGADASHVTFMSPHNVLFDIPSPVKASGGGEMVQYRLGADGGVRRSIESPARLDGGGIVSMMISSPERSRSWRSAVGEQQEVGLMPSDAGMTVTSSGENGDDMPDFIHESLLDAELLQDDQNAGSLFGKRKVRFNMSSICEGSVSTNNNHSRCTECRHSYDAGESLTEGVKSCIKKRVKSHRRKNRGLCIDASLPNQAMVSATASPICTWMLNCNEEDFSVYI